MEPVDLLRFAQAISNGVAANFSPPNQKLELEKLSELFQDMAMSLDSVVCLEKDLDRATNLRGDVEILSDMACFLDDEIRRNFTDSDRGG